MELRVTEEQAALLGEIEETARKLNRLMSRVVGSGLGVDAYGLDDNRARIHVRVYDLNNHLRVRVFGEGQ
jgi:hypothetical protein